MIEVTSVLNPLNIQILRYQSRKEVLCGYFHAFDPFVPIIRNQHG